MAQLKSKFIKVDEIYQVEKLNELEYCFRLPGFFGRIKTRFCDKEIFEKIKEIYRIQNQIMIQCECGKDKHGFAIHSHWCPKKE